MKVETKLTDRDLKLIKYVISILVVFILFWVGIRPLWETHQQLADELATQQGREQQASDASLTQDLVDDTAQIRAELASGALKGFSTTDDAASITNLMTTIAKSHGLRVVDFTFALPADETTYAPSTAYAPTGTSATGTSTAAAPDVALSKGAQAAEKGDLTGIYLTNVQIVVSGSETQLKSFVDDCAQAYPGMRVQGFKWEQADTNGQGDAGWRVTANLAVYSYKGN